MCSFGRRFLAGVLLLLCPALLTPSTALATNPPASRISLADGARLIISEQHEVPMVVIQVLVDAGARRDPAGQEGLASLTADLLTEGTQTRTASQISDATDFIGASLDTSADTDYALLSLTVLRKDLDTGLTLLADVLLHPSFPEAEVARRRAAALAAMDAQKDNPGRVAERAFRETLFHGEPYGHPVIGTPAAVAKLARRDVVAFYKRYYHPERSIITVVGDVATADITHRLRAALAPWSRGTAAAFEYPKIIPHRRRTVRIDKPISQANIILGERGVARDNPDYYALTVMNYILGGGGFASHLMENIRTKAGLAYSVGSFFTPNKAPGSFQVVMQTKNESATDAIRRACEEVDRMRSEPVTGDELKGAKLYLTGSFPLRLDSDAKLAGFLTETAFFELGPDYADTYARRINAVTAADVQRVAQQYLHPDKMDLVVVADLSQAKVPVTASCGAP